MDLSPELIKTCLLFTNILQPSLSYKSLTIRACVFFDKWQCSQFQQDFTSIFLPIFFCQKIIKTNFNYTEKNTFVQKILRKNVGEVHTWGRFHQKFAAKVEMLGITLLN